MPRALLAMVLLFPSLALAQRTKVLVITVAADDALRPAELPTYAELFSKLGADERLSLIGLDDILEGPSAAERRSQSAAGRKALHEGDLERASQDDAKADYVAARKSLMVGDWREQADALVAAFAWSALLTREEGGSAGEDMTLAFTMRPDWSFPAAELSPAAKKWVQERQAAKAAAPKGPVEIQSSVPCMVWVDGTYRGVTPLTVPALVSGRHLVSAVAPGYRLYQHEELLSSGGTLKLTLDDSAEGQNLRAAIESLRGGFRSGDPSAALATIERLTGAPELLVLGLRSAPTGITATAVRYSANGMSTAERSFGNLGEVVGGMLSLTRALHDQPLGVTLGEARSTGGGGLPGRGAGLLTLGGGAVVAVAGIIMVGVGFGQADSANKLTYIDEPRGRQQYQAARTLTGVGWAVFGAGVAIAALGAVLWLLLPAGASSSSPPGDEGDDKAPKEAKDPFASVRVTPFGMSVEF